jgi:hypothetical protein
MTIRSPGEGAVAFLLSLKLTHELHRLFLLNKWDLMPV